MSRARVATLIQTASVLLVLSAASFAQVQYDNATQFPSSNPNFQSERGGYTFTIPRGWTRIPKDALDQMTQKLLSGKAQSSVIYEAGFQSAPPGIWFQYPYILIQIIPYAPYNQPNDSEMADAIRSITGIDPGKTLDTALNQDARKIVDSAQLGTPQLDTANRCFTMTTQMHAKGIGDIKGELRGFFGKEAVVQIAYFDRSANWPSSAAARASLAKAFTFDAEHAYDPKLNGAGGRALMRIGIALGVIVVIFVVAKIKQASKQREV